MAFIGKKYKKVKVENIEEFLKATNASPDVRGLLSQAESVTSFEKNADGSLQYVVTAGGKELLNQKLELGKEKDFNTPDGKAAKITINLEGDSLKTVIKYNDGRIVRIERAFEGDYFKTTISADGSDVKALIYNQEL